MFDVECEAWDLGCGVYAGMKSMDPRLREDDVGGEKRTISGFFGIFPFFWQKKIYIHQEN
ncbi:MAG: hypothetical protein IJ977_04645 [Fibrobacter sp.]|nr:hypothetical protein [Fibrobacter sp.]